MELVESKVTKVTFSVVQMKFMCSEIVAINSSRKTFGNLIVFTNKILLSHFIAPSKKKRINIYEI